MAAAAAAAAALVAEAASNRRSASAAKRRSRLTSRYNASGTMTGAVENPQNRRNLSTTTDLGLQRPHTAFDDFHL